MPWCVHPSLLASEHLRSPDLSRWTPFPLVCAPVFPPSPGGYCSSSNVSGSSFCGFRFLILHRLCPLSIYVPQIVPLLSNPPLAPFLWSLLPPRPPTHCLSVPSPPPHKAGRVTLSWPAPVFSTHQTSAGLLCLTSLASLWALSWIFPTPCLFLLTH